MRFTKSGVYAMRRLFVLMICMLLMVCLAGCGTPKEEAPPPIAAAKDFDGSGMADSGAGTFYVSTPGGTSDNGNVPVLYADADASLVQIGAEAWGFDGTKLSFIYVDGMLNSREQLADTQFSLSLTGSALTPGAHVVEVVQYEGDDPTKSVGTYKNGSFEVKAG